MHPRRASLIIRFLTGAALLLVTAGAAAHEIRHALDQHDAPGCALHLLAEHSGKALATAAVSVPVLPYRSVSVRDVTSSLARSAVSSPNARAPPVSSV